MAARRGKSQAKRNSGGDSGLPGWAWMVLGILLAVVAILVAPKYLKSSGDGFFRPQPNPDARPAQASGVEDEAIADEGTPAPAKGKGDEAASAKKNTEFDFYTVLTGKEVPMTDAELAASEREEARRQAAQSRQAPPEEAADLAGTQPKPQPAPTTTALPRPVESETVPARTPSATPPAASTTPAASAASPAASATSTATATAGADDGTRYLLQAGAFQASGQAEEMKARIAMLGLSARVESASINGGTVYRVRMGPYGTASDLADAKRKLSSGGMQAMAIKVR
ncbi:SPOR domain-containing protein [Lysobacter sp.]|uniref:SPOR domain-containing protein n=1 Tax=Lysobacter sp. TaxID=72226 RepID=UPI002D2A8A74|nr:SPOR domain-containing protein [Lysobacter sp.]HZX78374.1 SPOR domain-containing protein [Lysobacter sp.]